MLSAYDTMEGPSSMTMEPESAGCNSELLPQVQNPPIMAICTDSSRCGCAMYIDSSIQLVADRKDSGDPYKGLDIIIQKIDPEVVIISVVQKKLMTFLEKRFAFNILDLSRRDAPKQEVDHMDAAFLLVIAPNIWFGMSRGFKKLIDCELVTSQNFTDLEEKTLYVTSRVEKSLDVCAIRSIAAIDSYMMHMALKIPDSDQILPLTDTSQLRLEAPTGTSQSLPTQQTSVDMARTIANPMPIWEVKYVDPGPVLSIDRLTFESLGIFDNRHRKRRDAEEDTDIQSVPSLYDLLNQCQSAQGKRQMHTIMMWPLQDINEIRHRHEAVDYFMRQENKNLKDQITINLKNVVPLSGLMTKLSQSICSYRELATIYKSLWTFVAIFDLIKGNNEHDLEIFSRIINLDTPDLRAIVDTIISVVDFEASKREKRVQVNAGVAPEVDEKREVIENLMRFCDEVAVQETAKYKDILRKICNVLYVPRIGFLNSVDYSSTTELLTMRSNREFEIILHTEKAVYFKTPRMIDMDNNAGDIACDLIDMQETVLVNLQENMLKHCETILRLMELCGELDCLITFARVSFERGYTRPEFNLVNQEIDIKQAYHPMQCMRYNIIPNDIRFYNKSAEREVKIMILTGPNSCGKTTYMKSACLVIYMAHIGCFVPAVEAKIPVVDAILTRLHSAKSISTGLSSFATDLHQINYALGRATERSLIAIDEFGKGTQARDGFHLLKGLITYFVVRTQKSPFVIAATHFSRLANHLQNYSEYILYKTFKVTRDQAKDSVTYEFKIIDGVGEISLADKVAARASIPERIIERANQIRDYITEGRTIKPRYSQPSGAITEPPSGA